MAIVYEEELKRSLKNGTSNIYIIFGDDGYLKKMYKDKISRAVSDPDDIFNFQKFGPDCDLQEVYDAVLQFPMMSDKKCVILNDYDFEQCNKADFDKLCTVIAENPDTCVLILWFDSMELDHKKSSKFKKLVSAAEKNNGIAALLNHRTIGELVKMLTDGAQKRGCRFDNSAARYLVETTGQDINTLVNELEKLCAFASGGEINKAMVDSVAVKTVEASIYNLSKQIIDCNMVNAMKTLDDLFFMRIEPIFVLSVISSCYVDMYRVFVGKSRGMSIPQIAEKFGYKTNQFVLDKAQNNIKKFDFNKFALSFDALCKADKGLKSFSSDARTVLEQLVVKLGYIAVKGEALD
jgi:DNA polymerase-3 subunit delta